MANKAHFVGKATSAAGGAGNESYVELWNPAASGKELHVTRLQITSADTTIVFKHHTSKQGTTAQTKKGNKTLGGTAPSGELYGNNAASVSGTQFAEMLVTAGTPKEFFDRVDGEPIKVTPGKSLVIENAVANLAMTEVLIEWTEVVR